MIALKRLAASQNENTKLLFQYQQCVKIVRKKINIVRKHLGNKGLHLNENQTSSRLVMNYTAAIRTL